MFATINVLDASPPLQHSLPPPVVHFKGFGRYINFKNNKIQKLQSHCIHTLYTLLENGGSLIWDGDSYNNDSFTFMIPLLFDALFKLSNLQKNTQKHPITNNQKHWLFLAFIKQKDIHRFTNCWSNKLRISKYSKKLSIHFALKPLAQIRNFIDLGTEAINITKAKIIICFGGGYVVQHEYSTLVEQFSSDKNNTNIATFYVYDVGRFNKSTQKFELPALKAMMDFDNNAQKYIMQNRNLNNIAYFDADIAEWSADCVGPVTYCQENILKIKNEVNDMEQKNEHKEANNHSNIADMTKF